jgi:hypothetical protein
MLEEALWSSRAGLKVSLVCVDGEFRAASFGLGSPVSSPAGHPSYPASVLGRTGWPR